MIHEMPAATPAWTLPLAYQALFSETGTIAVAQHVREFTHPVDSLFGELIKEVCAACRRPVVHSSQLGIGLGKKAKCSTCGVI
jgi:hypothetical protein